MSRLKPLVLVAEDDPLVREIIRQRLGADYRVQTAATGPEALQALLVQRPQVTVLDINLPGLTGFEVLEALRDQAPGYQAPVIMLSARRSADDVRRAIALGAHDYMVKTDSVDHLPRRIERLLRASASGALATRPIDL
jgi:two-component system, OmpR family, response regulator